MKNIYDSGDGDKLIEKNNFPEEIIRFLEEEMEIILKFLRKKKYRGIVEAGCMHGRLTDLALVEGLAYLGIDIVPRYIRKARKTYKREIGKKVNFICANIISLPEYQNIITLPGLAVFPFNSLGNMREFDKAINAIRSCHLDMLVFGYQTNAFSNSVRRTYYENCGYTNLRCIKSSSGVRFVSEEGLDSLAFDERKIKSSARRAFDEVTFKRFSDIGTFIYCF